MIWRSLSPVWRVCLEEAWAAYCAGSIPIGAAVTDGGGRIVARGRNRMIESSGPDGQLFGNRMAHAEMNALLALGACEDADPRACALYTTMEPCPMCIGAIRMHLVGKVCYAARDPVAGSAALAAATPFMQRGEIEIVGPERDDLESVLQAMQAEFLLRRGTDWAERAEAAGPAHVPGVRLGRRLFASGELVRLRAKGAVVKEVMETLVNRLNG
jgi:tRNA(Arg) A34 adenosine deaminase TadA